MIGVAKHYVNNKQFYEALSEHKKRVLAAAEAGEEKPRIPNYIGECIYHISDRLSRKPNFINYSFRDEMISDGIENSIMYLDNFNPEKYNNPFAYFTQIIKFAFLRRIAKEKKLLVIKQLTLQNYAIMGMLANFQGDDTLHDSNSIDLDNEYMTGLVADFQSKKTIKKKKVQEKIGIEAFFEEEVSLNGESSID